MGVHDDSIRGYLIQVVLQEFLEEHLFDMNLGPFKPMLQEKLNHSLPFETEVVTLESEEWKMKGRINYQENGKIKIVDFMIS